MLKIGKVLLLVFLALLLCFGGSAVAKEKNLITVFLWDINDWDPHQCYSDGARLLTNIYETLVIYEDGKVVPKLATSWEKSDGGKVWTFKLRKGVKFQNGEPFNAHAVKYSIDRLVTLGMGASWIFEGISEIKVIDEYTVQFISEDPLPVDLMLGSYYGPYMMPPKLTEEKGADWFQAGNACGTGPYKLQSYEKGVQAVLAKFDDYWGGWKDNQFDIAIYKVVLESSTAIQLLKRGEMDIIESVPVENIPDLEADPNIRTLISDGIANVFYDFHNQKAPTDDINVRKAICHAVNVNELVETILGKTATVANGPISPTMWGYNPNLKGYDYNPEKAKELLGKSKYAEQWKKDGLDITITAYDEGTVPMAVYIQAALAKVGIKAEIDSTPWPAVWDKLKDKGSCPQMTVMDWWADYATPSGWFFGNWFVEEEPLFNWSYYSNPAFEELVLEGSAYEATDRAKATEIYAKAQQILLDDATGLFVADRKNVIFMRKDIKGFKYLPLYNGAYWIYNLHK
ncbi:MAG: ABC transporter substrate-binding protein [Desulfobacterales bacterium]|nr:ABC transporter substrate-binding protein [Desulfobacterales bacterium]